MTNRPLRAEDWFCTIGVLCGTAIRIAANWAPVGQAGSLAKDGGFTILLFMGGWFICKAVRASRKPPRI